MKKKFPWVFWVNISIRKDWFSYWWKSRGSNCLNLQVWIFSISIGRPWINHVLEDKIKDFGSLDSAKKVNDNNLTAPISFQIGKYE